MVRSIASVDRMTDFYLSCGVSGLTILGMMGEAPKLDLAEALAISNQVVRRANVPVVVGVSAPGFAAMRIPGARSDGPRRRGRHDRAAPGPAHR
jgi:dihydrodipicolinate synthase/N-acetylneuraminate lyase